MTSLISMHTMNISSCSRQYLKASMGGEDLRLLGSWASPFVLRARIALSIKSIEYKYIEEDRLSAKSELLLKSNPVHKKVPVLLHGDKSICESLIIVQYLDELFCSGDSILPSDPYDHAIARFWAAYVDDKWFPALRIISIVEEEAIKEAKIEEVKEGIAFLEEAFVKCSKGKCFFGGEKIGFLDISLGCCLQWLKVIAKVNELEPFIDESKAPNLSKWAENFYSHRCVKDLIPDADKLEEYSKLLFAKIRATAHT